MPKYNIKKINIVVNYDYSATEPVYLDEENNALENVGWYCAVVSDDVAGKVWNVFLTPTNDLLFLQNGVIEFSEDKGYFRIRTPELFHETLCRAFKHIALDVSDMTSAAEAPSLASAHCQEDASLLAHAPDHIDS